MKADYINNFAKTYTKLYEDTLDDIVITKNKDFKHWIIFEDKEFQEILDELKQEIKTIDRKIEANESIELTEVAGPGLLAGETIRLVQAVNKSVDKSTGNINNKELENNIKKGTISGSYQQTLENTGIELSALIEKIIYLLKSGIKIGIIVAIIIVVIQNSNKIMKVFNTIGNFIVNIADKLFNRDIQIATLTLATPSAKYILSFDIEDFEWELRYRGFKSYYSSPDEKEITKIYKSKVVKEFFKYCEGACKKFYDNENTQALLEVALISNDLDSKYQKIFEALINNKKDIVNNMIDPANIRFIKQ